MTLTDLVAFLAAIQFLNPVTRSKNKIQVPKRTFHFTLGFSSFRKVKQISVSLETRKLILKHRILNF